MKGTGGDEAWGAAGGGHMSRSPNSSPIPISAARIAQSAVQRAQLAWMPDRGLLVSDAAAHPLAAEL
jgi:hypothetical protein